MIGFGLWLLFLVTVARKPVSTTSGATVVSLHRLEWADFVAGGDYVLLRRAELIGITAAEARAPEKSIPKE